MTTDAAPLFGSVALAERIERVETQLITAATEAARVRVGAGAFVIPITCGAACYAEDGSPLSKIVGARLRRCTQRRFSRRDRAGVRCTRVRRAGRALQPRGSRHRCGIDPPGLPTGVVRERAGPISAGPAAAGATVRGRGAAERRPRGVARYR